MKKLLFSLQDNLFGKIPIGITDEEYSIVECSNNKADTIIMKYHYSHKATKNRFKSFEVNNGKGYLQLGYGIRPKMKHTVSTLITDDNYCEFDRMWLSDELPKNSESQVIGLLLSYIKQTIPRIKFIITYADESVGNTGIIYKATNAISIGFIFVDFYLLPSGERVHPVTMWHRHKTRAWSAMSTLYPGIKHIKGKYKQFRFLYVLNKGLLKKVRGKYQDRYAG